MLVTTVGLELASELGLSSPAAGVAQARELLKS